MRGDVQSQKVGNARFIDALRNEFCGFTIPRGFQRQEVRVSVTPDGNTAHYSVIDAEQLFCQDTNCPTVRIEISDSSWIWAGSPGRAVAQMGGVFGLGARAAAVANPLGNSTLWQFAVDMSNIVMANIPKAYRNILVRCWGDAVRERTTLVQFAMAVVRTRMGQLAPLLNTTTSELLVTQDTNNFVQCSYTFNWSNDVIAGLIGGPVGVAAAGINQIMGTGTTEAQAAFNRGIEASPNTPTNMGTVSQPLPGTVPPVCPPFWGQGGVRSTQVFSDPNLGILITQILEGFDSVPASVP